MKKWRLVVAVVLCLMTGCSSPKPETHGIVYRIVVQCGEQTSVYTSQEKTTWILNELRQLGQKTLAQIDPDVLTGRSYVITLERTDGKTVVYRTKGERFIRRDDEPWKQMDPKGMDNLVYLLEHLPPDE